MTRPILSAAGERSPVPLVIRVPAPPNPAMPASPFPRAALSIPSHVRTSAKVMLSSHSLEEGAALGGKLGGETSAVASLQASAEPRLFTRRVRLVPVPGKEGTGPGMSVVDVDDPSGGPR